MPTRSQRLAPGVPIDEGRLYSFSDAAALIPSPHGGTLDPETLHAMRRRGELAEGAVAARRHGSRTYYFLAGAELARLLTGGPPPAAPDLRAGRAQGGHEAAVESLRAAGWKF